MWPSFLPVIIGITSLQFNCQQNTSFQVKPLKHGFYCLHSYQHYRILNSDQNHPSGSAHSTGSFTILIPKISKLTNSKGLQENFWEPGRAGSRNKSASPRFRIQVLENNNLGMKRRKVDPGTQAGSEGKIGVYRETEEMNPKVEKGKAICTSSLAPRLWLVKKED